MSGKSLRIVYLANARLPTEKAHGYQICKMCEAFALNGVKVKLFHPYHRQLDPKLKGQTVFDYYGIRPIFEVETLPNWDIWLLQFVIRGRWFNLFHLAHSIIWGLYAAFVVRREKADIYFTRGIETAYWLGHFGLPTVYEAHALPRRTQRLLLKQIAYYHKLRLIVALTSFIKKGLIELGFSANTIIVLPDAVDLLLFENLPSKDICRLRLGLPLGKPIIGYVGMFLTLGMEKGIPELIEAMKDLLSVNGMEPLLLCVGGPMDVVPRYINLARGLGIPLERLKFIDRVPNTEVPFWLKACDVVVAPYPPKDHYAYFMSPLKIFEYMASGTPIVASNLPSIREILCHGKNAWLVPPNDPKALSDGIRHLLENPDLAKRLARQAREDVQQHTWKRRAEMILKHAFEIKRQY